MISFITISRCIQELWFSFMFYLLWEEIFFHAVQEHLITHFVRWPMTKLDFIFLQPRKQQWTCWVKKRRALKLDKFPYHLLCTAWCYWGLWYKFNNIALETFWYIKGMCCKFTYYFAVTDREYAFLFKSNAVGSIWSLMKIFYSSSCRRSLSVISFCSNINKKVYIPQALHFSCLFVYKITLNTLIVVHLVAQSYFIGKIRNGFLEYTGDYCERWHNGCISHH